MNMEVVCGTTLCRDGDDFGNVLLSKFPVIQTRRHNLSVKAREPRGALDVDLLVNGTPVKIVVTHLGLRAFERSLQIEMLLESVSVNDTVCTVLMGDFNVWSPVSMARRHLQKRFGNAPFFRTYPSRFPLLCPGQDFGDPRARADANNRSQEQNRKGRIGSFACHGVNQCCLIFSDFSPYDPYEAILQLNLKSL